jgi:VanZ family protein
VTGRAAALLARWGPALAVMVVIFVASATPGSELPNAGFLDLPFKKGGHLLGYALLGAAYLRGLAWRRPPFRLDAARAVLLAAAFACTDEVHQRFTPGRTPSVTDVLIDTVGATASVSLVLRRQARAAGDRRG